MFFLYLRESNSFADGAGGDYFPQAFALCDSRENEAGGHGVRSSWRYSSPGSEGGELNTEGGAGLS